MSMVNSVQEPVRPEGVANKWDEFPAALGSLGFR